MRCWNSGNQRYRAACALFLAGGLLACTAGCGGAPGTAGGDQVLLNDPLSFDGSLTGKLFDNQSTRASTEDAGAAQALPLAFDTTDTVVRFRDLAGNDLLDPNGQPIDSVPLAADGSFTVDNVPVGVDFTVCGDIGSDGTCDIENTVQVPSTDGGLRGRLDDVRADPLTTIVLAKFRRAVRDRGIELADLPVNPASVVARIVDTYTHLFAEAGIDIRVALEDIDNLTRDELAALFETIVPARARTGMDMAEGNLELARAQDVNAKTLRVAEIFLRAGFPIVDGPGEPDLSALGQLEGVKTFTPDELFGGPDFGPMGPPPGGIPPDLLAALPPELGDPSLLTIDQIPPDVLAQLPPELIDLINSGALAGANTGAPVNAPVGQTVGIVEPEELIYVNSVAEPNRNFPVEFSGGDDSGEGVSQMPMMNDRLLLEMTRLQGQRRTITLADLFEMLTDLETGMGLRLIYNIEDPNFFGPPLTVFQTADGRGKAIPLDRIFQRFFDEGLNDLDADTFDGREVRFRAVLRELLAGTVPPTFDRLFGAIARDRIAGIEALAERIRNARAHVPFSRSGPSTFFVVADGDPFRRDGAALPVTVNADVTVDGTVLSVTYDPAGTGRFFLGFTGETEGDGLVELLVRETGNPLHGPDGRVLVSMKPSAGIFQPINGQPFFNFVSESGTFYPGTNITVFKEQFEPEPIAVDAIGGVVGPDGAVVNDPSLVDPGFNDPGVDVLAPDGTTGGNLISVAQFTDEFNHGPNEQIFVLATGFGHASEPLRVDYDPATGVATFNPDGRNVLMFLPDSEQTGLFALFNEDVGRPAGADDPTDFFGPPPALPDGFDDVFNSVDDFSTLDSTDPNFDAFGDVLGGNAPPGETTFVAPDGITTLPPGTTDPLNPAQVAPAEPVFILVAAADIVGVDLVQESFTIVFGAEVPNRSYDASGDPVFDDINDNGVHDADEPTAQFRPTLFDPFDWRSTDVRLYYRRADNNGSVTFAQIDFNSPTPATVDGVLLLPRRYRPRLNAFRFGRPNTAINLLTAFAPPGFFDGTRSLNRNTPVGILSAIAIINLMMDQVFNVEADIDPDGVGPLPRERRLMEAHLFAAPIGDPFVMLLRGFRQRSIVRTGT